MVKIMENPIKMDDFWGKPTIFGNIHIQNAVTEPPTSPQVQLPNSPAVLALASSTEQLMITSKGFLHRLASAARGNKSNKS